MTNLCSGKRNNNHILPHYTNRCAVPVCGKLLTSYFIVNLHHHYLPTATPGISLADSFANFVTDKISSLSPVIFLFYPHTHPPLN